ncbi:MAG: hypothetical protein LBL42_02760 [Tannerella sp.]|nr:hypothetical protein [Tannerella sp.]
MEQRLRKRVAGNRAKKTEGIHRLFRQAGNGRDFTALFSTFPSGNPATGCGRVTNPFSSPGGENAVEGVA